MSGKGISDFFMESSMKYRCVYDRYKTIPGTGADLREILIFCAPKLRPMLEWLEEHLASYEFITTEYWAESWWYIIITDTRPGWGVVENYRVGFTVDLKTQTILWNDSTVKSGNCFVRSNKWKKLVRSWFFDSKPISECKKSIHWYATINWKRPE